MLIGACCLLYVASAQALATDPDGIMYAPYNWTELDQSSYKSTTVPMTDAAILFSPYNWDVSPQGAKTINPGAYFRVAFTGASAQLNTSCNPTVSISSQFWTRVDGGPLQQHTCQGSGGIFNASLGPPFSASGNHLLEVIIKSTTETDDRWNEQKTAITFNSIILGGAATSVRAPNRKPFNVLIYGDSITEGVRTLGYQGITNDTGPSSSSLSLWQTSPPPPPPLSLSLRYRPQ
jgi:hypothetical protein